MKLRESSDYSLELKFREVYDSPEWKSLHPIDRAQLLLVAEGAKNGTIIGGDFTNFEKIIKKMGLASQLNTDPLHLHPVHVVATPEKLSQYNREILSVPINASYGEFHKVNGKFLGYPVCCTEEYIDPSKNLMERKKKSPYRFLSNVDFEMINLLEEGKDYPEPLDFCPPSFTPCSCDCEAALSKLGEWQELITNADSEAAKNLQIFNWQGEPYSSFHRKELAEEFNNRELEWKILSLRRSVFTA